MVVGMIILKYRIQAIVVKEVLNGDVQMSSIDTSRHVRGYLKHPGLMESPDIDADFKYDEVIM